MANIITITRVLLTFIVMGLLFFGRVNAYLLALGLTVIIMWFDGLDGYIARKFNETSKFGALLDIVADRIVENLYWLIFAVLGFISPVIPAVVLTRGILTDSIRSLALEQGYTAFGETTMQQNKIAKFIVTSNFSRFTYAVCKAVAFIFIIAGNMPLVFEHQEIIRYAGKACAWASLAFCVARGLPVILESKRFLCTQAGADAACDEQDA